jgi:hypothetical protein
LVTKASVTVADALQGSTGATPPGGGNFTPMDSRVARLEVRVEHVEGDLAELKTALRRLQDRMESDFRITWAGMIALGLGLSGLMAKGFGWL